MHIREAKLKRLGTLIPAMWHSERGKTMQTIKRPMVKNINCLGLVGRKDEEIVQKGLLEQ